MKNAAAPDIKPDLEAVFAIRDPMIASLHNIQAALDAVNAYAAICNGRSDVIGAINAYEAREAVLELQAARQKAHNRLAALLVDQYGAEQAKQVILLMTKGPGR